MSKTVPARSLQDKNGAIFRLWFATEKEEKDALTFAQISFHAPEFSARELPA